MESQTGLEQRLNFEPEGEQILLVDQLFYKSYNHFVFVTVVSLLYCLMKIVVSLVILALPESNPQNGNADEKLFLILLIPISVLQLIYYICVKIMSQKLDVFLSVGSKCGHAAYEMENLISNKAKSTHVHDHVCNFKNPNMVEIHDKDIKVLALAVKWNALKENIFINILGKLFFLLFTTLQVFGIVILAAQDPETTHTSAFYVILTIVSLSTFQYLEVYLGFVLITIIVPIFLIHICVKSFKKSRSRTQVLKNLNSIPYHPLKLKGEHSCHICMEDYKEGVILTVLACNEMHHFHRACLLEWVKVGEKCPLCRSDIIG